MRTLTLAAAAIALLTCGSSADAQIFPQSPIQLPGSRVMNRIGEVAGNLPVIGRPITVQGPGGNRFEIGGQRGQFNPGQQTYPVQPVPAQIPFYRLPQHPIQVSQNRIVGRNPYTGGWDTSNQQVDNTYYDPTRGMSENNGTKRFVRRPIHNAQGQITGYQEGYVWNNSYTGVEHGLLKNVTENDKGGVHEQVQAMSVPNK